MDEDIQIFLNDNNNNNNNNPTVWVFGYGSLCWYPGFEYSKCITGYVRGFARRFWQGNVTHRGTVDKPGIVATLVEDSESITWGCAYKITGNLALDYLKKRECDLGGYSVLYTKFYPRIATEQSGITGQAFPALLYIATPKNSHWLGERELEDLADQITHSTGPSGHNIEYLLRLAQFMHDELPGAIDDHLFELETLVRNNIRKYNICITSVMGLQPQRIRRDSHENIRRPISFEHTSRVPDKKLRCLNI